MKRASAVLLGSLLLPWPLLAQQGSAPPPWAPWVPWLFPSASGAPLPTAVPTFIPSVPGVIPAPAPSGVPVVVELFTSTDCPACDSAEYTMNRLEASQPVPGARIVPLAFHVEFYGGGAGSDPYLLAAGTRRQSEYDAARGRVYTPQAIVDGDRELVASQESTARSAVAAAARVAKVTVQATRSTRASLPGTLPISIRYGRAAAGGRGLALSAVVTESHLVFEHKRADGAEGERTPLAPVVRSLQTVGSASPGGGSLEASVSLPLTSPRGNLTVVILLQETATHHIVGAATLPVGPY